MARFSICSKFHSTIGFNGVTPFYTTAGSDLSVYSRQSRNSYRLFTFAGLIAPVNCRFANNKCVNDYILYVHTSIKTSNEAWSTTIINKPQSWIFKLVCNSRHLLPLAPKCRHFHRKQSQEVGGKGRFGGTTQTTTHFGSTLPQEHLQCSCSALVLQPWLQQVYGVCHWGDCLGLKCAVFCPKYGTGWKRRVFTRPVCTQLQNIVLLLDVQEDSSIACDP